MNPKSTICIILLLGIFAISCFTNTKVVSKIKSKNLSIKFYYSYPDNEVFPILFAQADSGKSRFNYYFKENQIYKLNQKEIKRIYTLSFKDPEISDSINIYFSKLSNLDLLIFNKANILLDSLNMKNHKKPEGAKGFYIEVSGH